MTTAKTRNNPERDARITMQMLEVLASGNDISQRNLSTTLGIALGATNAHLNKCVSRGLVRKVTTQVNRAQYQITPQGLAEKSRLNSLFLKRSLSIYQMAKDACRETIRLLNTQGNPVFIWGDSALSDIAYLGFCSEKRDLLQGFIIPQHTTDTYFGLPALKSLEDLPPQAVVLYTQLDNALETYNLLAQQLEETRIFVPSILARAIELKK